MTRIKILTFLASKIYLLGAKGRVPLEILAPKPLCAAASGLHRTIERYAGKCISSNRSMLGAGWRCRKCYSWAIHRYIKLAELPYWGSIDSIKLAASREIGNYHGTFHNELTLRICKAKGGYDAVLMPWKSCELISKCVVAQLHTTNTSVVNTKGVCGSSARKPLRRDLLSG